MQTLEQLTRHFRRTPVFGSCVDLVPYAAEDAAAIVRLRNLPEVRYFMNQDGESTVATQDAWHHDYLERSGDLFWVVRNKAGATVGCNRLYNISTDSAEKGSQIVDPEYGRSSPIALEADMLAMKLAFNEFGVRTVIYRTREDNVKVQAMNARFGFREAGEEDLRGVRYFIYRLEREDFHPEAFDGIIAHWSGRSGRRHD